jgi:hypothetical protein
VAARRADVFDEIEERALEILDPPLNLRGRPPTLVARRAGPGLRATAPVDYG